MPLQTRLPSLELLELEPELEDPVPVGAAAKPVEAGPETPASEDTAMVGKEDESAEVAVADS